MKLFSLLFNKYTITLAAFTVLMLFFDQADWFSQQERKNELKEVSDRIAYFQNEVDHMEREYEAILRKPEALERYARESYRMKRDTEDIYIIERK